RARACPRGEGQHAKALWIDTGGPGAVTRRRKIGPEQPGSIPELLVVTEPVARQTVLPSPAVHRAADVRRDRNRLRRARLTVLGPREEEDARRRCEGDADDRDDQSMLEEEPRPGGRHRHAPAVA